MLKLKVTYPNKKEERQILDRIADSMLDAGIVGELRPRARRWP